MLKVAYGNACLACGKSEPEARLKNKRGVGLTKDHIIPLSKGGSHAISNLQPLCLDCNLRKFTSSISYLTNEFSNLVETNPPWAEDKGGFTK